MRIRNNKESHDLPEIDFLFNDVTRTKIIETNNAEFKYKTIFLSKVAHEFKNPLICITELIDQINDEIICGTFQTPSSNKENLDQIKAFSNYVKDLDFFSKTQNGKNIILNKAETKITDIIKFCEEVGECLIRKFDKKDQIKLIFTKSPLVPFNSFTDEGRLKQVLVNLISNSIKFTHYGEVELELTQENINEIDYIKFCIKDTGTGIKNDLKEIYLLLLLRAQIR